MDNLNEFGVHEVTLGSRIRVLNGKYGTIREIRLRRFGQSVSLTVEYDNGEGFIDALAEELDEFKQTSDSSVGRAEA